MCWRTNSRPAAFLLLAAIAAIIASPIWPGGDAFGADPARPADGANELSAVPEFSKDVLVRIEDDEVSLYDAIGRARSDRRLKEYRQLRATHGETASAHRRYAHWCRKQRLEEREELHWKTLLYLKPKDSEAVKYLGLREYRGELLTVDELKEARQQQKDAQLAARNWMPELKKIRRNIRNGDQAEREQALKRLQAIANPAIVPMVEAMFAKDGPEINSKVIEILEQISDQKATSALIRKAVLSPYPKVREQAAYALKGRPYDKCVRPLISGLSAPVEVSGCTTSQSRWGFAST